MHHNINLVEMTNKMQLVGQFIIPLFLTAQHVSSDIIAHHQELLKCNYGFWFYSRLSLPAAVMTAASNDKLE
jgi:hypothetical protein